jgi:hypothetical protein
VNPPGPKVPCAAPAAPLLGPLMIAVGVVALLYGCWKDNVEKQTMQSEERNEKALFMTDSTAFTEIDHRLEQAILRSGYYLTLVSPEGQDDVVIVSVAIPWKVGCGYDGLRVVFGDSSVRITDAFLTEDRCKKLAPYVADTLRKQISP